MGGASAKHRAIGGFEFNVLDYGNQMHMPTKLRALLNDGNALGANQCSSIHLEAGLGRHLKNDQMDPPAPPPPPSEKSADRPGVRITNSRI